MSQESHPVHQSLLMKRLLNKMPEDVAESFSEEQLIALNKAIGGRSWARHKLDLRGTVNIWRSSFYFVILAGKNRRELSRLEEHLSRATMALMLTLFVTFCTLFGLLVLYLIKSALGINLFEDFSLGIWSWFKQNVF
ncbi:3-phosphoshikimate 1-carboxyvinyltransferase [Alteromonas confluentis]|uniref:3-phosphoshikimate 1-carboxyvinyltransferase n=1 Tax=Alteromonas confluentis TaxID=1656094 RepID=A0A1E7Z757_9ALTE|nr:3-phosphoshikimate 1-carboxyvinyltransferase [Alteromonas confluentis]OFC69224.1 3-phosphoshikimate 1-carboxyvinyltransferase [Alteromonas confluentis]